MEYKYTTVAFGALRKITGPLLQWQYNTKQFLVIKGLNLPEFYEVDFGNIDDTKTITMPAHNNTVEIPDQLLKTGRPIVAYIVIIDGDSVNTIAQATFHVNKRGERTDIEPEPAEQLQVDALIDALNDGVSIVKRAVNKIDGIKLEVDSGSLLYVEIGE